jgi:hypothetical protein
MGMEAGRDRPLTEHHIGPQTDQLSSERFEPFRITAAPSNFDPQIFTFAPSELREPITERRDHSLRMRITLRI